MPKAKAPDRGGPRRPKTANERLDDLLAAQLAILDELREHRRLLANLGSPKD